MTPKFYGFLWIVFGVSAGILWLGNVFTLLAVVVFGFIAFGLIFAGMMCVLPGTVSHPPIKKDTSKRLEPRPARPSETGAARVRLPHAFRTH